MATEQETLKDLLFKADPDKPYYSRYGWQDMRGEGDEIDGFTVVETIEGDDRRWARFIEVIVEAPSGKFYKFGYDHGLTEMQEDEAYDETVVEVEKKENTVVVVTWEPVS